MNGLSEAFVVMAVGMLMVFLILALVVFVGNIIIRVINKIDKGEVVTAKKGSFIENKTMAAIVSTVEFVTQGQGKIVEITKIK